MTSKFTYFNLRARGSHIILLLEYAGEKYEANTIDLAEWEKFKPNYPFQQIPFYEDGKVAIPQSAAICRYLANKHHLFGKDDVERAQIDVIYEAFEDTQRELFKVMFDPEYQKKKESLIKEIFPKQYAKLDALLKKNHDGTGFYFGDSFTLADANAFHILNNWTRPIAPDALKAFPALEAYRKRIAKIPQIAAYLKSSKFPATTVPNFPFIQDLKNPEQYHGEFDD